MDKKLLDFSEGNPALPMTRVANYAFRQSSKDLNSYHFMNNCGWRTPVGKILHGIGEYFTARGIHPAGWTGLGNDSMLMTGGGTTEGYELIIRVLAQSVREEEKRSGREIKPVILMPVPTYGFFFHNPENYGIEVVKVERDMKNGGRLDPQTLIETIKRVNAEGKRIVAYYDCNPHNPLGLVRGREETEELARIFMSLNRLYRKRDDDFLSAKNKGCKNGIETDMGTFYPGYLWDGLGARVAIIDDMVYDGLEYEGAAKPFAFAQLRDGYRDLFKDTFTLFGLSKVGLTNVRAGLVAAHYEHIHTLLQIQKDTSYFPPKIAMHALEGFFSLKEPFKTWREEHLKKMNALHEFNGKFLKALVNGLSDVPESTAQDRREMVEILIRAQGVTKKQALARLNGGIAGLRVTTSPQAGFFHMIDFSALKGRRCTLEDCQHKVLEDGYGMKELGDAARLAFASGTWAGLNDEGFGVRVTLAKSPGEIAELANRLEWMVGQTKPAARSVKDLETKRKLAPV